MKVKKGALLEPGNQLPLLYLKYRNSIRSERIIEMALGKVFLDLYRDVVEVGAVTPYYSEFVTSPDTVIDITDKKATLKINAFDFDYTDKNVLSISTVEHVGTGDYGIKERRTGEELIDKIIKESNKYLITFPIGYNFELDKVLDKYEADYFIKIAQNFWISSTKEKALTYSYGSPFKWGNALVVIHNIDFSYIENREIVNEV